MRQTGCVACYCLLCRAKQSVSLTDTCLELILLQNTMWWDICKEKFILWVKTRHQFNTTTWSYALKKNVKSKCHPKVSNSLHNQAMGVYLMLELVFGVTWLASLTHDTYQMWDWIALTSTFARAGFCSCQLFKRRGLQVVYFHVNQRIKLNNMNFVLFHFHLVPRLIRNHFKICFSSSYSNSGIFIGTTARWYNYERS